MNDQKLLLLPDMKYSRRYRHHQLVTQDGALLWSHRQVSECLRWARREGYKEIYIVDDFDSTGLSKKFAYKIDLTSNCYPEVLPHG